jgi:tetratricopeptide (TPR) repeat protein
MSYFKEAESIIRTLVTQSQGNLRYRRDLSGVQLNKARLLILTGDTDTAAESAEEALSIGRELVKANGANIRFRLVAAASATNLGIARMQQGRLKEARLLLEEGISDMTPLVGDNVTNMEYRRDLANGYHSLGNVLDLLGFADAGIDATRKGLNLREAILAVNLENPLSVRYKAEVASSLINLGLFLGHGKQYPAALTALSRARILLREAVDKAPDIVQYRRDWVGCHINAGSILRRIGKIEAAMDILRQGETIQKRVIERSPEDAVDQALYASLQDEIGKTLEVTGDWVSASLSFRRAVEHQQLT